MKSVCVISDFVTNRLTSRRWLLSLSFSVTISLWDAKAWAFDPTAAIAMAKTAYGIYSGGGMGGGVEEAIDSGFAFGELLNELDVETGADEEANQSLRELEELKRKTYDLKDSQEDLIRYFERDLKKAKSSAAKLRAIKNMIESSKRIASIMGIRPKTGQAAASVQQMKINTMILKELEAIRRNQEFQVLKENQVRYRRSILLDQIVKEERQRQGRI